MNKQSFISILLTILMSMTGEKTFAYDIAVPNFDGVTIYYEWANTEKTELAVSYSSLYSGNVVIPESVVYEGKTYNVTSIDYNAFYNCNSLTSVTIPNTVTSIGNIAFQGCSGLTSITIPNSVTSIGSDSFSDTGWYNNQPDGILYLDKWLIGYKGEKPTGDIFITEGTRGIAICAFKDCSDLTSVVIPKSVMSIGWGAFWGCSSLIAANIPEDLKIIECCTFSDCSSLSSINIPNTVETIEYMAFMYCSSLNSVKIPNSVTSIGYQAFWGCSSLTSAIIPNSVKTIGYQAFYGCSSLASLTIPNGVTTIEEGTFARCRSLTTITIPNSVTTIEGYAFAECWDLTTIIIPNNVTTIGEGAFNDCRGLTSVTLGSSLTNIGSKAFSECDKVNSVYIKDLSSWCNYFTTKNTAPIFSSNYHLYLNEIEIEELTIPESINSLGNYVFYGCSYINSVIISNSVKTIGASAFEGCSKIEKLQLPDELQIIKNNSFKGCNNLKSVTIPANVEFIYQEAFANCNALESIKAIPETPPFLYDNSFSDFSVPLKVPKGCKDVYKTAQGWKNFTIINESEKGLYSLIYIVDSEEYKSYEIEEGTFITPELAPTKDGYAFSGWSEIPKTMPSHDVEINGRFYMPGDANGDGVVNIADIVEIVNFMNNKPSDNLDQVAANVTGDDKVNEDDIAAILDIIMNK